VVVVVVNQVRLQLFVLAVQPGQLPATGGAAPGGASLDVDDVAGEIDQDRGEGRASFPAVRFPDGGSGSSERIVPIHSTGN